MNYRDKLIEIERGRFDEQDMRQVRSAEEAIVSDHAEAHSGVLHVPAAIVARDLRLHTQSIRNYTEHPDTALDYEVAQRYVIARTLANCLYDNWNPTYTPTED